MMRHLLLSLSLAGAALAADAPVPIHPSDPLEDRGEDLSTSHYKLLADEEPFAKKITEKQIVLWESTVMPKPEGMSDEDWERMKKEDEAIKAKQIPIKDYQLAKQAGEYVGWFGIIRSVAYDEKSGGTLLTLEHKYFDGLTDTHLHIVSLYGAGDFQVALPGKVDPKKLPLLALVRAYGKVTADEGGKPLVKAEYLRLWDWGLFTFMDYGVDKSNPEWVKLRKVGKDDIYTPDPGKDYYIRVLGTRK